MSWGVSIGGREGQGPGELGGKAWNLRRLGVAGVEVPAWIVLPAGVRDRVGDAPEIPEDLRGEVEAALREAGLGRAPVAVRSSAVGEDASGASFAGQFETVLGVEASEPEALWGAIRRVWASAASPRVLAYAGSTAPPPMAVLIQVLVQAEAAGVAFSADPVSGDRGTTVVSAVRGLGDALVAGEVDADAFRVALREGDLSVVDRKLAAQDRALRPAPGGTRWEDLSDPEAPAISDEEAVAIAAATRRLAAVLGGPQDVEWALEAREKPEGTGGLKGDGDGRRLLILQARPITTLATGERRLWDNSNIIESYAGVTTPLTFSFARGVYEDVYRQFCRVMGVDPKVIHANRRVFAGMLGLVQGRVYYNLLNWYRMLSFLPGYAFNRGFMERMMGVRERLEDPPEPPGAAGRFLDFLKLLGSVLGVVRASRKLPRTIPAFHQRVQRALGPLSGLDLTSWSPDDLAGLYRRLEEDLLRHWQPPLVNDFFAMIWFGVLSRLVERWLPEEPPTLVNELLAGEGGMISTEPARGVMALAGMVAEAPELGGLFRAEEDDAVVLAALRGAGEGPRARLAAGVQAYLGRYGDRCANELKLETVTLSDDPSFLMATVRSYWRQGATDAEGSRAREVAIRTEAERRVARRLGPVRHRVFRAVLRRAREKIRDRENLRFERTRVFGAVRRIFLGLGHGLVRAGRLHAPRDVFWLTVEEVLVWAEGTAPQADFGALAEVRRREFDGYRALPAPPDRFETHGPPTEDVPRPPARTAAEGDLLGTGCCPGVVRAPVRVVRDPREAGDLGGRILVAERTDPGWTLLFPAASGLLVQRGSLLSHSAIVAREMGLPCVVGVPALLETLQDGELVEMDGTTGAVRRLEGGSPT